MKSRTLILDRQHLVQLLRNPEFYEACPLFAGLREQGLLQTAAYTASEAKNCCGGTWSLVVEVVNAFYDAVKAAHRANPDSVKCLREFLAGKKGWPVGRCVIFYRPSKSTKPRRFSF
jgi:hypothetical protein